MTDQIFLIPTAFGKSSDLTVSGIGHSVIRGLVTNRLMVRRDGNLPFEALSIPNTDTTFIGLIEDKQPAIFPACAPNSTICTYTSFSISSTP